METAVPLSEQLPLSKGLHRCLRAELLYVHNFFDFITWRRAVVISFHSDQSWFKHFLEIDMSLLCQNVLIRWPISLHDL